MLVPLVGRPSTIRAMIPEIIEVLRGKKMGK
jgi:hypothetical protein